jgi:hypothetical protein
LGLLLASCILDHSAYFLLYCGSPHLTTRPWRSLYLRGVLWCPCRSVGLAVHLFLPLMYSFLGGGWRSLGFGKFPVVFPPPFPSEGDGWLVLFQRWRLLGWTSDSMFKRNLDPCLGSTQLLDRGPCWWGWLRPSRAPCISMVVVCLGGDWISVSAWQLSTLKSSMLVPPWNGRSCPNHDALAVWTTVGAGGRVLGRPCPVLASCSVFFPNEC